MKLHNGLIVEPHPDTYTGFPFVTLLQFRKEHFLTIVDDSDDVEIKAIVLDLCSPQGVDKDIILSLAEEWYNNYSHMPISVLFSMRGYSNIIQRVYRTFSLECTTRAIGPLPRYNMDRVPIVKRKRKRTSIQGIAIESNVIRLS